MTDIAQPAVSRFFVPPRTLRPRRVEIPATVDLLIDGGDARLALDPQRGTNKYGCGPRPDPGLVAFGSSTASVISERGFAAAERLRRRLVKSAAGEPTHLP